MPTRSLTDVLPVHFRLPVTSAVQHNDTGPYLVSEHFLGLSEQVHVYVIGKLMVEPILATSSTALRGSSLGSIRAHHVISGRSR